MSGQLRAGNIPVLNIVGANIPEAWERAILAVWEQGTPVRTEYDRRDADGAYIDPPSRDATAIITVIDPFAEPRVHKNFPGGPEELEIYRQEVVEGVHDHWVDPTDPLKWTYTYHERLCRYAPTEDLDDPEARKLESVDQMAYLVEKCVESHFTRRAQAITWMPTADPRSSDPPCLQRIWCRLLEDEDGALVLNLNTHWRSRDAYKAWFMNVFAITDLQRRIAEQVAERAGREVRVGRYVDISDSFHIYGLYFADVEPEYQKMKADPDYARRAWRSDHPALQTMFEEARAKLKANPDFARSVSTV